MTVKLHTEPFNLHHFRYFTPLSFFLPVLYMLVVGLFFNEGTKSPKFLNRDQTDEWKGQNRLKLSQ